MAVFTLQASISFLRERLFSTTEIGFGVTQVSLFTKQVYLQFEFDFNPCRAACVILATPEQLLGKRFT